MKSPRRVHGRTQRGLDAFGYVNSALCHPIYHRIVKSFLHTALPHSLCHASIRTERGWKRGGSREMRIGYDGSSYGSFTTMVCLVGRCCLIFLYLRSTAPLPICKGKNKRPLISLGYSSSANETWDFPSKRPIFVAE